MKTTSTPVALIYRIDCAETGLSYVGQTILPLEERWRAHVDYAGWVIRHRPEKDTHFARAIRKYGRDAFVPCVIEETMEASLDEREIHWIAELGTFRNGYNSTEGGGGRRGYECSEETRERMRLKAIGRKHSSETIERIAAKRRGVKQDPVIVEKRAAGNRGKKRTDVTRARMSTAQLGHEVSAETRARISKAGLGRVTSEDTKRKLGRRVNQLTRDGQYVATFDTLTSAALASGYSKGSVCNNIRDPERWPLQDVKFEYVAK
jgi:group I intron endonuclease